MADVVLNGVVLNRSIQWIDRYVPQQAINQKHKRTVAGTLVILQKQYSAGSSILLSGSGDTGWFTRSMMDSILGFSTTMDLVMVLDFKSEIINVMFDWSSGIPATFTPIKTQETYASSDWFQGELKLIRV